MHTHAHARTQLPLPKRACNIDLSFTLNKKTFFFIYTSVPAVHSLMFLLLQPSPIN